MSRKRPRRSLDMANSSSSSSSSSTRRRLSVPSSLERDEPLRGVIVCLSGLTTEQKTKYHRWIEQLGGRYTRDLDTSKTTHLIACAPEGAKYDTAAACSHISIVTLAWLENCVKTGVRPKEKNYGLMQQSSDSSVMMEETSALQGELSLSLGQTLDKQLVLSRRTSLTPGSQIFSSCRFLLIGFEERSELHNNLSTLIRRGMGTIYWELNEVITHLVVNDDCDDSLRDAAGIVISHHPNGPAAVSPWWVISSWKDPNNKLVPPALFPPRKALPTKPPNKITKSSLMHVPKETKAQALGLFRGCIFALMRLSPPLDGVDFSFKELEAFIASQGGQLISSKLVQALRVDSVRGKQEQQQSTRTCYVICWGGYTPIHVSMHPLLSQLKNENLCTVVPTTPIWLKTCLSDRTVIPANQCPRLFQPQTWPTRRLPDRLTSSSQAGCGKHGCGIIKVAVTGFVGPERTGIIHLICAIGATYTENMRSSNTHLICKERQGQKFDKAVQWGLHVVSVDWLHHIAQHGYGGKNGAPGPEKGCESDFSLVPRKLAESKSTRSSAKLKTLRGAREKPKDRVSGTDEAVTCLDSDLELESQEILGSQQLA